MAKRKTIKKRFIKRKKRFIKHKKQRKTYKIPKGKRVKTIKMLAGAKDRKTVKHEQLIENEKSLSEYNINPKSTIQIISLGDSFNIDLPKDVTIPYTLMDLKLYILANYTTDPFSLYQIDENILQIVFITKHEYDNLFIPIQKLVEELVSFKKSWDDYYYNFLSSKYGKKEMHLRVNLDINWPGQFNNEIKPDSFNKNEIAFIIYDIFASGLLHHNLISNYKNSQNFISLPTSFHFYSNIQLLNDLFIVLYSFKKTIIHSNDTHWAMFFQDRFTSVHFSKPLKHIQWRRSRLDNPHAPDIPFIRPPRGLHLELPARVFYQKCVTLFVLFDLLKPFFLRRESPFGLFYPISLV